MDDDNSIAEGMTARGSLVAEIGTDATVLNTSAAANPVGLATDAELVDLHAQGIAPSHDPEFSLVGTRLGRYQIGVKLGEGGMASVYRATDTQLHREVAIKVLHPHIGRRSDIRARFDREARAVAALRHRHILEVFDVGGGGTPYMVLELIEGGTLGEFLDSLGQVPLAEFGVALGVALCDALEVAHGAGVVHRDIKPSNIMFAEGGRVVLTDFGVAQVAEADSVVTQTGALLGTPAYMSPEQAHGEALDLRSDLYSLGATLYRTVTGSPPYGGSATQVITAMLSGKLVPAARRAPKVGGAMSRVIGRLMAANRADRHASAAEVRAELKALLPGGADPNDIVRDYIADPRAAAQALLPTVISHLVEQGRGSLNCGNHAAALSFADRLMQLDDGNAEAAAIVEGVQHRQRRWPIAVGGVVLVIALGVGITLSPGGEPTTAIHALGADAGIVLSNATNAKDAGGAEDASSPAPVIDAAQATPPLPGPRIARNKSPRAIARNRTTAKAPTVADGGGARAPVEVVEVPMAPPIQPVPRTGTLVVKADAWCDVVVDGAKLGRATTKGFVVTAGPHQVECTQGLGLGAFRQTVNIVPGAATEVRGSVLTIVQVRVEVSRAAAVRIGSKVYKRGEVAMLRPKRYRIQLLNGRGKVVGAKWVGVGRRNCILRDAHGFGCFAK